MRLVLLMNDQANQRALACRLASQAQVAGIVLVRPTGGGGKRKPLGRRLLDQARRVARSAVALPFRRSWFGMLAHYEHRFPRWPEAETIAVGDVNEPASAAFVERLKPDLVVVSGTNLLRAALIAAVQRTAPILNLHTGISPYIRGAPNCTNWCLAEGRFDLIGNTVMWIDAGIDTGDLAATERTPLTRRESLTELHIAVMDHAHDLLVRCVGRLAAGQPLPRVRQRDLAEGQLFLSRQWQALQMARALLRFRLGYRSSAAPPAEPIRLISPADA